jgi:flagellar hook assembly protein FlgD
MGQKVTTLIEKRQPAGIHTVSWNGRDEFGKSVTKGIYWYRLETKNGVSVRKMLVR